MAATAAAEGPRVLSYSISSTPAEGSKPRPTKPLAYALRPDVPFLARSGAREGVLFIADLFAARVPLSATSTPQFFAHRDQVVGVIACADGLVAVATADAWYPNRILTTQLRALLAAFRQQVPAWQGTPRNVGPRVQWAPAVAELAKTAAQVDAIARLEGQLVDVKEIMLSNIEAVLARGEKLDVLVDTAAHLSATSRLFYKTAKKTNACCVIA